jgi:AcrR family transcriptional regulator
MLKANRRTPTGAAVMRQDVTDSIVEATLDELAEKGYQGLSMDAVARRAGVGKSALYRRWPSKQEMTISILAQLGVPLAETADTGSFRGDIRALLDAIVLWFTDPRLGPIFVDLNAAARTNDQLGAALTEHVSDPRRNRGMEIIERALARGELPADVDRELALDTIAAPVYWRLHIRRLPISSEYLDSVAGLIVRAFAKLDD